MPREGHDAQQKDSTGRKAISILVPREGHDYENGIYRDMTPISILVPREGHDTRTKRVFCGVCYFNPRAP